LTSHPPSAKHNDTIMFLKPTPARLTIAAVFLVIAYGGYAQSWAFSAKDLAHPPPPLMGLFEPVPYLWESWILLLVPLALLFRLVGIQQFFDTGPAWFFWTVQALYFYLISCLFVFLWNKFARRRDSVRTRIRPI
jgi:hypothetical protein